MREDIPELIHHFTARVCDELQITPKTFCQRAVSALVGRDWPGNVRELQNVVRRIVMFCPGQVIQLEDLNFVENPPQPFRDSSDLSPFAYAIEDMTYKQAKQGLVDSFTTRYIASLLKKTGGNVTKSAEISGLSRGALQKIMKRLDIKASGYRADERE
jgi:DNA-binding NtrC family response regulator